MRPTYLEGQLLGYVVVEYNQASRQPGLPTGSDLIDDPDIAWAELNDLAEETRRSGRGEQYRICAVITLADDCDEHFAISQPPTGPLPAQPAE